MRKRLFSRAGATSKLHKLDSNLIDKLCKEIKYGCPFNVACDLLGISRSSFYLWKRKGAKYIAAIVNEEYPNPRYKIYADFYINVERARALFLKRMIEQLEDSENGKNGNWKVYLKILSRRDFKHWGPIASRRKAGLLKKELIPENPNEEFL